MQIRLLALAALTAAAGLAAGAGRLLAVRPAGDAEASVIELVGDRPLSFTSLRLASPPRVVVDVADADPSGVASAQLVDDGTVRRVAVAAVGSIARVVIELAGESEFDVRAVGTVLQVRVARLSPLVAKAEPPREVPPPAVRPDGPPEPALEPPPERSVVLQGLPQPSPAATPEPTLPAPAAEEPPQPTPVAIAAAPPVVIPAPSGAAPGPAQPPATRAEPAPAAPPAVVAQASPPPERRVARAEGTASREEVERARASIPTVSIVASPPPAAVPTPPPATAPRPPAARTRASITAIGFRPSEGGMVLVRSDRPLDYTVTGEGRVVIVHLRGAGIPIPTNRLPLDTRFFDTPVVRVVPESVAGGIDLRIELRGQTRYQLSQASGLLTIAFERT